MAAITAAQVQELREKTGLGMMLCKKALTEADGNMEIAIENLRKQGQATMEKRAAKAAKEGCISILERDGLVALYEVNSETDFVARNDDFVSFSRTLGEILLTQRPSTVEEAAALRCDAFGGTSVSDCLLELTAKIGEKIGFRRFVVAETSSTRKVFSYLHGTRIGVVLTLECDNAQALVSEGAALLGKDLAMQIAASNPLGVSRESIPTETVAKEREIYLTQAQGSGKPEKIWEKIVEGKLAKFFGDVVLLEQPFIKEPDVSVQKRIDAAGKECSCTFKPVTFTRFELGAGE